jgi:hypothetical protein
MAYAPIPASRHACCQGEVKPEQSSGLSRTRVGVFARPARKTGPLATSGTMGRVANGDSRSSSIVSAANSPLSNPRTSNNHGRSAGRLAACTYHSELSFVVQGSDVGSQGIWQDDFCRRHHLHDGDRQVVHKTTFFDNVAACENPTWMAQFDNL